MKTLKIIFMITILLLSAKLNAQWTYNGNNIHNSNLANVGIGTNNPLYILDVAKSMTEPTIAIRNLGSNGGATLRLIDQTSNSDWKFKSISTGGFKIRDQIYSIDVLTIENNSAEHSFYVKAGGNVGIGTNNPESLLDIAKFMTEPTLSIRNLGSNGGASLRLVDQASNSDWKFKSINTGGIKIRDQIYSIDVLTIENNAAANCIYVKAGGNVGIGTSNPTTKLAVNGKIDCKEVEVYLSGWSDFVFAEGYQLRSLTEVDAYVKEHKHLPGVPSEQEVLEDGVNLGEMNAILLEKIEELTLYMIELKKDNEVMKIQIGELMEK